MKDEFHKPVDQIFFAPGIDAGMAVLGAVDWTWQTVPKGRIAAASISDHPAVEDLIDSHIKSHFTRRTLKSALMFNTLPVQVYDVAFVKSFMSVGGKWVLSGAMGTRLRNVFARENLAKRPDFDEQIAQVFQAQRDRDVPALPLAAGMSKTPKDFVLDCRNYFNFYHFTTETLPQLCAYADLPNPGRIKLHAPSKEVQGFIKRLVEAHFPELADKVDYIASPAHYDSAYSVLNTRHLYHQCGPSLMPDLDVLLPNATQWDSRDPARIPQSLIAMNSYDANLKRLRDRAIAAIGDMDTSHLPRRFWVARAAEGPRARGMLGEEALIKDLARRGFEVVHLEHLSPMEQVALFHNAEIMMSYHGAGFANMIYAGKDTYCVELGNYHSCLFRWQDFTPHAHVSGCRYVSLFADINQDDPSVIPPDMRSAPVRPVALLEAGHARVLRFVDTVLGTTTADGTEKELTDLGKLLNQCEAWPQLARLMDAYPDLFQSSVEGWMTKANCLEGMGELWPAFRAVETAWEMDPKRPFVFERMALIAVAIGEGAPMFRLKNRHADLFPERHEMFLRRFRRMRQQTGH